MVDGEGGDAGGGDDGEFSDGVGTQGLLESCVVHCFSLWHEGTQFPLQCCVQCALVVLHALCDSGTFCVTVVGSMRAARQLCVLSKCC